MFKEFKEFILRGNVVELAVAVVIAAAFGKVIDAMVALLTNLVAIPGNTDFSELDFTIGGGVFKYGVLINTIIAFLLIAAVIFFVIVRPLNKLAERRRTGEEPKPVARPDDVLLLEEIRDLLRAGAGAGAKPKPTAKAAPASPATAPPPAPE